MFDFKKIIVLLLIAVTSVPPVSAQAWLEPGCDMPTGRELGNYLSQQSGGWMNDDVFVATYNVATKHPIPKAMRASLILSEFWCKCAGEADPWACIQANMDKESKCELWDLSGFADLTNPFGILAGQSAMIGEPLAVLYETQTGQGDFCDDRTRTVLLDGELACCRYYPDPDLPCHSGAHQYAGSCMGAPSPPFDPQYYGPAAYIGTGWTCDHHPECTEGTPDQRNRFKLERWLQWMHELAEEYGKQVLENRAQAQLNSQTACTLDFATLVGCKGFEAVVAAAEPFATIQSEPDGKWNRLEFRDINTGSLVTAAQRVMFAIPNGLERYDYIESRIWTPASRARHLQGIADPEAELRKWLSECGLQLLKASMPGDWELMAVPVPVSKPSARRASQGWVDGCLEGTPPQSMTASAVRNGHVVSVDVSVVDPDTPAGRAAEHLLSINWGDGEIEAVLYRHGASNSYQHTYDSEVPSSLRLVYANGSGHVVRQGTTIQSAP